MVRETRNKTYGNIVRETRNKRYYESDNDQHQDDRSSKRTKKNPIREHYTQSPEPGSPEPGSPKPESSMAMARRLSQDAIKEAFSRPATPDKPVNPEKIDAGFIKSKHIRDAIKDLVREHDAMEEKMVSNPGERERLRKADGHYREALQVMNNLRDEWESPGVSLENRQSHWDSVLDKGRSDTLSIFGLDNPHLEKAIASIKAAVLKEQNAGVTAQRAPESLERETPPPIEAGSSQQALPEIRFTFTDSPSSP